MTEAVLCRDVLHAVLCIVVCVRVRVLCVFALSWCALPCASAVVVVVVTQGTTMVFAGIKKDTERRDLIAFLKEDH
jgi:hypothetical protein